MTDVASPDVDQFAIEDALDDWIAGGLAEADAPPEDEEAADRLLAALAAVGRRRTRAEAVVQRRMEQLQAWLDEQHAPLAKRAEHLTALLDGWARAQHERSGMKTFQLPSGTLQLRPLRQRTAPDPRLPVADLIAQVRPIVPEAVHQGAESLHVSDIAKIAEPGEVVADWPNVPVGYEARQAVVDIAPGADEGSFMVVPGVVLLVPVKGLAGQTFSVKIR